MPYSSGIFSRLYDWATEQLTSPIEISKLDAQEQDMASALSNCLLRDGTGLPTASIDWNGQKITNLGAATAASEAATLGQVQSSVSRTLSSVAGTNTITASLTPALTSYTAGMIVVLTPAATNTGAVTLAVNGLTALDVQKASGDALVAGDLVIGIPAVLVLDGGADDWILLNPNVVDADTLGNNNSAYYRNASNLNAGSVPSAQVAQASVTQHQAALSIATSQLTGNMPDARIVSTNVTQHQASLTTRNISGKSGTTKTLSSSAPSGGSDGDIWYRY